MKNFLFKPIHKSINKSKGFTIIELMVAIAVVAILASVAIYEFKKIKYKENAYKFVVKQDIKNTISAVEAFAADYGHYPKDVTCGSGPAQCDLKDDDGNTIPKALNVSPDVTIKVEFKDHTCDTGEAGYIVTGSHAQIDKWTASYNSCTSKYSNF